MKVYMTKVFQNGGSQAVRIPAEFRFDEGAEIHIYRGPNGELCLSAEQPKSKLAELVEKLMSGELGGGISDDDAKAWNEKIRADRKSFEWRDPWNQA
jgi:virulence-associated protein VagC